MKASRVLIVGGTGAIGSALVERFAQDGALVRFTYRNGRDEATSLVSRCGARSEILDVRTPDNLSGGEVDVLVYNAGINLSGRPALETSSDELIASLETNLLGALRVLQRVVPGMVDRRHGRVILINSVYGLQAPALRLSYSASKFGLHALMQTMSRELAPHGVTVNEICPGPVDSAMLRAMGSAAVSQGRYRDVEEYLADVASGLPIGRLVKACEVADAAAFLASDRAGACTGVALRVDGGLLG